MDDVDRAKEYEMRDRQANLERTLQADNTEEQLIVNGEVICLDCLLPIPEERLAKRSESVRCVPCKTRWENRGE